MIELHYKLTKDDYLNFQLYIASHNPRVKNQRLRGRIIICILFVLLGIGALDNDGFFKYIFFICAIVSLFLYPIYFRWFYKRHYKKQAEHFFDEDGGVFTARLKDLTIETQDKKGTSTVKIQELLAFIETGEYFYLQLSKAAYFILPKDKIPINEVREYLQDRSKELNIPYKEELDWKWK